MTRVLLTGASGFVGRHVLPALVEAGYEVHAVSSRAAERSSGPVTWHHVDLLQSTATRVLIDAVRPEGLVHLAWFATPPAYWQSAENLRWVSATMELLRAFVERGGHRIVGAGTCAEYDWTQGCCVERDTPLAPATVYGAAKAAVGLVLEKYASGSNVSAAWARLFFLFGPDEHPTRLIPSVARELIAGRVARCTSGRLVRDFLHVEEAARAIVALFTSEITGPVNVASGVPTRIADVAQAIASQLGRGDLLQIEPGADAHQLVVASVQRLRHEVGWAPSRTLEAALADTVQWWQQHAEAPRVAASAFRGSSRQHNADSD